MSHILLTGAGFTRNWGGWLAKELEGDLLARLANDPELRKLVQSSINYEQALEIARHVGFGRAGLGPEAVKRLEEAIKESFWAMNTALAQKEFIDLSEEGTPAIQEFLARFDAIFTLNQDLLLELHYDPKRYRKGRWEGTYYPGLQPQILPKLDAGEVIQLRRQVGEIGPQIPDFQPIYKLHGSIEWLDGTGSLFVVGGGKDSYIRSKPLLRAYSDELQTRLLTPDARLMVIGYGFADVHINELIFRAWQANQTLSVYYVHPEGRDAVHQGKHLKTQIGYLPPDIAQVPCIGESRRPLSSTFAGDTLEYDKLMRFFS
jgi:SIR2-like domain